MMQNIKTEFSENNQVSNVLFYLTLITMVLPKITVLGYEMPVTYLLIPVLAFVIIFSYLKGEKRPEYIKSLTIIFLLILLEIVLSSIISTLKRYGNIEIPTDIAQYIARFIALLYFARLAYMKKIKLDTFIKFFLIILIIGMTIGMLQWLPWPGREFFINLYPFRDGTDQLSKLHRPIHRTRIHGFAQHGTAVGGVAVFATIFALSIIIFYKRHRILSWILVVLSVVTIIFSQGRAAQLAAVFAVVFFFIAGMKYNKTYKKPIFILISISVVGVIVIAVMYFLEVEFVTIMVGKWLKLFTEGDGRMGDAVYFFDMMSGSDWLFGLSRQVIGNTDASWGIEIEPLNIFVTYGLIGFLLQYGMITYLLIYFFKRIDKKINNPAILALVVTSFVGLFSYQVFSVGYYFFREIQVGLFIWVVMGTTIGAYEKQLKLEVVNNEAE